MESRLESLGINLLDLDRAELERLRGRLLDVLNEATLSDSLAQGWELSDAQVSALVEQLAPVGSRTHFHNE